MAGFRVEFSYYTIDGYTDWEDVTEDLTESSASSVKKVLESNDYGTGSLKFNSIKLDFRNDHGYYSAAVRALSKFPEKRDETLVRVLWSRNEYGVSCGASFCGLTFLSPEVEVFKGLINDNATKFNTEKQIISFTVLGVESIIDKVEAPYASLTGSDTCEDILYKCLNQSKITQFFTVSAGNINVNYNFTPDDITSLENKTVFEVMEEILFLTGSVFFIENDTAYIRSRAVDPTSSFTFYAPSSDLGIENVMNISNYVDGVNRTFNFWTWKDTALVQKYVDSIEKYGVRKKEIDSDLVTDTGKRTAILLALLVEYGFPKVEFELTAPLYTEIAELDFLNKVKVDYPTDYLPQGDQNIARYNQAIYGQDNYSRTVESIFISLATDWKIINKTLNIKNSEAIFRLREV